MLTAFINGKIIKKATIRKRQLAKLPQFVRFNKVELCYKSGGTIEEKCKMFVNYLHDIEAMILNGVNQIHFVFPISKMCLSSFSDHLQILNYLQKELLPVCGTPRGYKFEFSFDFHYPHNDVDTSGTNLIAQILQLHPIDRCSNIEIKLCGFSAPKMQWPCEAISNWLHQKPQEIAEKSQKRFLKIYSGKMKNFPNERELCDHLREVKTKSLIKYSSEVIIGNFYEKFKNKNLIFKTQHLGI